MLNHNYVYDDAIYSYEDMVNDSVIALLDMREDENSSYISQDIVNDYLYDMYGVTIDDFSEINKDFPNKEGYVFILPRGFSEYHHEAVNISENEDGTFTFVTRVTINNHDSESQELTCETLFVKNEASVFGYNIVYSKLFDTINAI